MNETMLKTKDRLKTLARKGRLPLIPEAVKFPHLTGCVTFTTSGVLFDPLIILPNKKNSQGIGSIYSFMLFCRNNSMLANKKYFYLLLYYFNLSITNLWSEFTWKNKKWSYLFNCKWAPFSFLFSSLLNPLLVWHWSCGAATSHIKSLAIIWCECGSTTQSKFLRRIGCWKFDSYVQIRVDLAKYAV